MDQVKEYLKLAVKYRFWIIVGIAAVMPIAAYYAGAGEMEKVTTQKTADIKSAESGVKAYQSKVVPNAKWTQLTEAKKAVLTADVNKSWKKLYDRQAPLLDWPGEVQDDFKAWGDTWPKDVDVSQVRRVINFYVQVYPDYVTRVYQSFHPWNFETGEGIVVTVPKEELLRPAVFDVRNPPTLSKVHVAQKRLWIQRTMLDVVRTVNEKAGAKDWDTARIKQITALEVASARAQDQKSAAKGEALEPPAEIVDPTAPVTPTTAATGTAPGGGGGREGGTPFGGSGGKSSDPESVEFIKSPAPDQYFVVPVALGVLIDQDHISDLLVEFENSPMSIQVVDFDWERPSARVQRPVKGEDSSFVSYGNIGSREGLLGIPGGRGGRGGMTGPKGMLSEGGLSMPSFAGRQPGGQSGGGGASTKKGTDVSSQNLAIIKAMEKEAAEKKKNGEPKKKAEPRVAQNTIADPFFNIVEVHIYGRARFYRKPPEEAAPASVPGGAPAPAAPEPAKAEPAKDAAPAAPGPDAKKDEPAKAEEPKKDAPPAPDAKKDETPKPDAKAEEPKPDAKAEAPKDEPKKDEPAKAEPPKAEPKKDDSPKR